MRLQHYKGLSDNSKNITKIKESVLTILHYKLVMLGRNYKKVTATI